jgi:hypothetical protein
MFERNSLHKILTYNKINLNNSSLIFVQIREGHHTEYCARPLSAVIKKHKPHLEEGLIRHERRSSCIKINSSCSYRHILPSVNFWHSQLPPKAFLYQLDIYVLQVLKVRASTCGKKDLRGRYRKGFLMISCYAFSCINPPWLI